MTYHFYMYPNGTHQRAVRIGKYCARYIQRMFWAKYEYFELKDSYIYATIPNQQIRPYTSEEIKNHLIYKNMENTCQV